MSGSLKTIRLGASYLVADSITALLFIDMQTIRVYMPGGREIDVKPTLEERAQLIKFLSSGKNFVQIRSYFFRTDRIESVISDDLGEQGWKMTVNFHNTSVLNFQFAKSIINNFLIKLSSNLQELFAPGLYGRQTA